MSALPADALALEERRRQALLAGDLAALQELLAASLVYVHSTGVRDGRDSYLAKLASGSLRYLALAFEDLQVQQAGQAWVVHGAMRATVRKDGADKAVASLFMTVWAADRDGTWRLQAHQGTPRS
jgi:ketosteroid isomerase-like protein